MTSLSLMKNILGKNIMQLNCHRVDIGYGIVIKSCFKRKVNREFVCEGVLKGEYQVTSLYIGNILLRFFRKIFFTRGIKS